MFGVYIGRFQPFHIGHQLVINEIIANAHIPLILIGSANESGTKKNPLTSSERQQLIMLDNSFSISPYNFRHIPDFQTDEEWVTHLREVIPADSVIYYYRKDEDVSEGVHYIDLLKPYYEVKHTTYNDKLCFPVLSATKIRENLEEHKHYLSGNVYNSVKYLLNKGV